MLSVSVLILAFLFLFSLFRDISPKNAPGERVKKFSYLYRVTNLFFSNSSFSNKKSYEFSSNCVFLSILNIFLK